MKYFFCNMPFGRKKSCAKEVGKRVIRAYA
jgi:hypothetical protein